MQSFPLPASLHNPGAAGPEPVLYGWCSDRVHETGRIHSWATAGAIEFLVDFRRLLQERINMLLRVEFISHHTSELKPLTQEDPTDLAKTVKRKKDEGPLIKQLMTFVREHKKLELAEGAWLPRKPPRADISFWSGLFYGPPGTSKTFLAQAMAAELNWPLISVSPSDFLSRGNDFIEARAQEIFSAFGACSRAVLFFDEIDELIRDRSTETQQQRSELSFLTPSFLTKLQDLRVAAKKNEFIFILATNYQDRIDAAAIRSGRIDQSLCVVYPDEPARASLLLGEIGKMAGKYTGGKQAFTTQYLSRGKAHLKSIDKTFAEDVVRYFARYVGFLSYQRIQEIIKLYLASPVSSEGEARLLELDAEDDRFKELFDTLCDITGPNSPRFKPEINLSEYGRRPRARMELERLIPLIPDRRPAPKDQNEIVPRARQLTDLYKAADASFAASVEEIYVRERNNARKGISDEVLDHRWPSLPATAIVGGHTPS